MANVKISTINTTQGYQQPVNPNADGVVANGFYPQNATSNDANAGIERGTSGELALKAGGASIVTVIPASTSPFALVRIANASTTAASLQIDAPTYDTQGIVINGYSGAANSAFIITGSTLAGTPAANIRNFDNGPALRVYADGSDPALVAVAAGAGAAINATGTVQATTFSGSGALLTSIPNSATTATASNTANTIVTRDASGNFSAGTITAALSGNATSATTATTATSATTATNATNASKLGVALTTTNATYYPAFALANSGNADVRVSTGLTYNPSTSTLTTTAFSGTSLAVNSGTVTANSTDAALRVTQTGSGEALRVEDSANPDASPFVVTAAGDVGVGKIPSTKLDVLGASGTVAQFAGAGGPTLKIDSYAGGNEVLSLGGNLVAGTTNGGILLYTGTGTPAERLRITSAGDVGVGTAAPTGKFEVVSGSTFFRVAGATYDSAMIGPRPANDGYASLRFLNAIGASNSFGIDAGASLFTINYGANGLLTILSGGNIGIGAANPGAKLEISGASSVAERIVSTGNTTAAYPQLGVFLYSGGSGGEPMIELNTARGSQASPTSVQAGDTLGGYNAWGHNGTGFFAASRIKTTAETTFSSARSAYISFWTVSSGTEAERVRIESGGNFIPIANNSYKLGKDGNRWSEVFATNGTINTSDARLKTDVADSDLGLAFIEALRPVSYRWIVGQNTVTSVPDEGEDEKGNPKTRAEIVPQPGVRPHYGFIAQEVKATLGDKDFGGYTYSADVDEHGLRYTEFIAPLVKAVQELSARVKALETELAAAKAPAEPADPLPDEA